MRSIHGPSDGGSDFMAGFVFALLTLAVGWVGLQAVRWLLTHDFVAEFVEWWTTPVRVVPADLLYDLLGVVGILLILAILILLNGFFGPRVRA